MRLWGTSRASVSIYPRGDPSRSSYPVSLIVHEYLLERNDSIVLFRSRFVDLTVEIQLKDTL